MPRPKKRPRRNGAETEATSGEYDENGVLVSGEPAEEAAPSLGGAIESVRDALEPFDDAMRKRVVRAAVMMLK